MTFQLLSGIGLAQTKYLTPDGQISLLNPFGGEYFQSGIDTQIRWETTIDGKVEIQFSSDGGNNWSIIRSNIEAGLGSIDWVLPNIKSAACKVKIIPEMESSLTATSYNFSIGEESILPRILVDEEFEDWDIFPNIAHVTPGADQGHALKVINDKEILYIYFETDKVLSLQNNNSLTLYIDSDDDLLTGKPVNGIGAEIEFRFGERQGIIYFDNNRDTIGVGALFLIISPTVWSDRYEITMNLNSSFNGKKLFTHPKIRLLIRDESTGSSIPSENGGAGYQFGNYTFSPLEEYSLVKTSDEYIRILSHNVLFSSFFRKDRKEAYMRMYQAIQPDIIGFSELYPDYSLEDVTTRLEEILPSDGGKSWKAKRTADNVLATRFSFKHHSSAGPFGNGAFLLDLRPAYNNDLLVIVAHPTCCDNDSSRQDEVDAIAAFIRDAKSPGSDLTISDKTPVIIVGDMNFVGDPRQVTTLLEGDIVQEDIFGEDFTPDWDGTFFDDAKPFSSNLPHTFTHTGSGRPGTYSNGRLDYFIYSGSVLELENSFVMFTPAMPENVLAEHGVKKDDSETASDHLPVIGDFRLTYEQEESTIYTLRKNDKNGIPVNISSVETITGIVTASKEFGSDRNAFIENDQAAIAVYGDDIVRKLRTGDLVTVTGTLSQSSGLTQLTFDAEISQIIVHKKEELPKPRLVTIAEVKEQEWNGRELLEGRLIKIEDVQILSSGSFSGNTNYKITDDRDTLEIKIDENIDLVNISIPAERVSITGCLGQFKSSVPYDQGYLLYPRSAEDLDIIKEIEHVSILKLRQNNSQGVPIYNDSTKTVSGIVTATTQFGRNGPAFIQDGEAGVAIYGNAYVSKMNMGDSVTITGPLVVYKGLTEYVYDAEVSEVVVHKNVTGPEPQLVTISDINSQKWNGKEMLEGMLVKIENVTFLESGTFEAYHNYQITDGLGKMILRISNTRNLRGITIPTGKVTVMGIVGQNKSSTPFEGGYQLLLRFSEDIIMKRN